MEILQGDILKVEGFASFPMLVVSKKIFNNDEKAMLCPISNEYADGFLHISIKAAGVEGTVLCEQVKLIDLKKRGYKKIDSIDVADIMNVTDAIQAIFDYI